MTSIEVDVAAAEIIRRANEVARAHGETLGDYLTHALPAEVTNGKEHPSQKNAWEAFVRGMTALVERSEAAGRVADDSRESMYGDRS